MLDFELEGNEPEFKIRGVAGCCIMVPCQPRYTKAAANTGPEEQTIESTTHSLLQKILDVSCV